MTPRDAAYDRDALKRRVRASPQATGGPSAMARAPPHAAPTATALSPFPLEGAGG